MRTVAWSIWREITSPSPPNEHPYHSLTIGAAHVLLGACAKGLLALVIAPSLASVVVLLAYGAIKERRDLRLGGSKLDCAMDLALVGFGTLYAGPLWWPVLGLLGAASAPFIMRLR